MAEQYGTLAKTLKGNYIARVEKLGSETDEAVALYKDACENKRKASYGAGVKHLGKASAAAPLLMALTDMGGALYRMVHGKQKTIEVAKEGGCKDAVTCMQVAAATKFEAIVEMEELYQTFLAKGLISAQEFADISCHGIHTLDAGYIKPLSEKKAKLEGEVGEVVKKLAPLRGERRRLANFMDSLEERIGTTIAALEEDGGSLPFEYTGNDFESRALSEARKELTGTDKSLAPLEEEHANLDMQYEELGKKLDLLNEERADLVRLRKNLIRIREDNYGHLNAAGSKAIADSSAGVSLDADEAWVDAEIEKLFGPKPA